MQKLKKKIMNLFLCPRTATKTCTYACLTVSTMIDEQNCLIYMAVGICTGYIVCSTHPSQNDLLALCNGAEKFGLY